ncbi:hypothetical protein LCGC14_1376590 [marine sediment metagenome]|uniref:DUF4398 domain-containing protein n=1 Tax=marine sediment metagenome TaxID=412755 RepID=A0A0F9N5W4_9ZZZZ
MLKRRWIMPMVVLVLFCMPGCATTMEEQYSQALTGYELALEGVVIWREAGLMSDDAYRKVEKARIVARGALDTMKAAIVAGDSSKFNLYYTIIGDTTRQIILWQKE